jgi:hypothetical protein
VHILDIAFLVLDIRVDNRTVVIVEIVDNFSVCFAEKVLQQLALEVNIGEDVVGRLDIPAGRIMLVQAVL